MPQNSASRIQSDGTASHLVDWLRRYAADRLNVDEMNQRGQLSPGVILDFGNKGLFGLRMPGEFGGTPLSLKNTLPVLEQLAAIDMTLAAMVVAHHTSSYPVLTHATTQVREQFLPLLSTGRMLASFAMSEPGAGSNPRAFNTALSPGAGSQWRINGTKSWCGGAAWAGMFTVFGRHVDGPESGISAFAVPRDKAGIEIGEPVDTMGIRCALLRTVKFRDVTISDRYLLGGYGDGLTVANHSLAFGRLAAGALSVGTMKRCAQLMLRYASRRHIGTGLLLDNPVTLARLTHVDSAILAVEELTGQLAADVDGGVDVPDEALLACKVAGSELAWQVADGLVQLLGARGYAEKNIAPRLLRDARFLRIGEGPTETLLMQLGASLATRDPYLLEYLRQHLGGIESSRQLLEAIDQFQDCQPEVPLEQQVRQTQWEYYTLGQIGIWSFLEAALEGRMRKCDDLLVQHAYAWARDEFHHTLRTALQAQNRQNIWHLPDEIRTRIAMYESAIGPLDQTIAVPQERLDPYLRKLAPTQDVVFKPKLAAELTNVASQQDWSLLTDLPTDRPYRSNEPLYCELAITQIPRFAKRNLKKLAKEHTLQLKDILLAGFASFLWRFSHQDDLEIVFYDAANADAVAIRVGLGDSLSVSTLLKSFSQLEKTHDRWPTPAIAVQALKHLDADTDQAVVRRVVAGGIVICLVLGEVPDNAALVGIDLCLVIDPNGSTLSLTWIYDGALYNAETITSRSANLSVLLQNLHIPDATISTLDVLPQSEQQQVINGWAGEKTDLTWRTTVVQLVLQQTHKKPDQIALIGRHGVMSYKELESESNRVARRLQQLGVLPGDVVAVATARSPHLIISILAALKAGAAFLSLNCQHPEDRLRYFLAESGAKVVLTEQITSDHLPPFEAIKCCVDVDANIRQLPDSPLECAANACLSSPESAAYVMFTSGSTGRPKGVMVSHMAICNQLIWRRDEFGMDSSDRILQSAAPNFDIAVWEFLGPLIAGGAIVLSGDDSMSWDAKEIANQIRQYNVTTIQIVPSQLNTFLSVPGIERCTSLRRVFCGGELLSRQLQEKFFSNFSADLINLYGPTEAAIDTTYWRCARNVTLPSAPIGAAVRNKRVYVLDEHRKPVPIGVSGELLIAGVGLASGYIGQPELTKQRFLIDPFVDDPQARMYASGDRVRFRADGSLEFLGRVDRQLKIRGVRIEPGELETTLAEHPDVEQLAVALRQHRPGDKLLVAFYIARVGSMPTTRSLREFAISQLPREVVPSQFVELNTLPITSTGKVDTNNLPEVEWSLPKDDAGSNQQASSTEKTIMKIWAQLLNISVSNPETDFFDIGGHSLLAVQVLTRVREQFNIDVRLKDFFAKPTVLALSRQIDEQQFNSDQVHAVEPSVTTREGTIALAGTQESLWYLYQLNPQSASYNVPDAVRLRGKLDYQKLQMAHDQLVQRHEALRTLFTMVGGRPEQRLQAAESMPIERVNLDGFATEKRESELRRQIESAAGCTFNLEKQRPFRAVLYRLDEDDHAFFWNFHHIIADGWSAGHVFIRDLSELYSAGVEGRVANLPTLPIQPIDYEQWQRERFSDLQLKGQLNYWKEQLGNLSSDSCIPTDMPRAPVPCADGAREFVGLADDLINELHDFVRRENTTSFTVLMAAFQCIGRIYSNLDEIAVGTAVAGRKHPSAEGLIGNFANVVVVNSDLSDDPTLRSVLGRTRDTMLEAVEHSDIPFERVVAELQPDREINQNPLFNVVLTLYNGSLSSLQMTNLRATPITFDPKFSKFDLTIALFEGSDSLGGFVEYRTDLYKRTTIQRLLSHFEVAIRALIRQPTIRISEINLLNAEERDRTVYDWNSTDTSFPNDKCLHQLFEDQVRRTPNNLAVQCENGSLNYTELNQCANQLAHCLRKFGVGPDVLVGVCIVDPDLEMFIGVMAVLKAGGAYVPIDPELPNERIAYILQEIESPVLLTLNHYVDRLESSDAKVICLDTDQELIAPYATDNVHTSMTSENLIYVIYTSGSTGKPKGVAVPHQGVARLVCQSNYTNVESSDRFSKLCNFAFDASTLEIWLPLVHGASIVGVPQCVKGLSVNYSNFIREQRITTMVCATALFHQIVSDIPNAFEPLKLLLVGGEAMDLIRAQEVLQHGSPLRFLNVYGPTETSVVSTYFDMNDLQPHMRSVPIGRPISNTQLYVVDKQLLPVGIGVRGELCIGGPGVARGYLNQSDLTRKVFVPDPFRGQHDGKLYRTGDMVRYLEDGNIEYLGRKDHQVKIRGFRIEIGEIETALRRVSILRESIVMVREDTPGDKRLVAFVVFNESSANANINLVRDHLQGHLPSFMVPTILMVLDAIPLTKNSKIDRNLLLTIPLTQGGSNLALVGPRDEIELRLMHLWQRLLGVDELGVHSKFFDVGGDSLQAMKLLSAIKEEFGKALSLAGLYDGGNIESLAMKLRDEALSQKYNVLIPLYRDSSQTPLFLVHPLSGSALCYDTLARHLQYPLFGLQSVGLDSDLVPCESILEMAACYVDEICAVQCEGPYLLGGWSLGGIVAFEMARELEARGKTVSGLIMFDSFSPAKEVKSIDMQTILKLLLQEISQRFGIQTVLHMEQLETGNPDNVLAAVLDEAKRCGAMPPDAEVAALRRLVDVCLANARAVDDYKADPINADIILIRAQNSEHLQDVLIASEEALDYDLGWSELTSGKVVVDIAPGEHMSMLFKPYTAALADRVREHLDNLGARE